MRTQFWLVATVVVATSCRGPKALIPPQDLPEGVEFPTSIDPIDGRRSQTEPTIAQIEAPGKGDSIIAEYPIVKVSHGNLFSVYRTGDKLFTMFEEEFTMKDSIVYDWTGRNQGALRIEFDTTLCVLMTKLRYTRDSIAKGLEPGALLVLKGAKVYPNPGASSSYFAIPSISSQDIDMVVDRSKYTGYLLVPIFRGNKTCADAMCWLTYIQQERQVQEMLYQADAKDSRMYTFKDGHWWLRGKKVKRFDVVKEVRIPLGGTRTINHRGRERK